MARWAIWLLAFVAGTAHAETVVFIEGLGGGPRAFEEVMSLLRDEVPLFFHPRPVHMPGDVDGIRTPAEAAQDLRIRLRRTGMEPPFIVVGHSLGGAQAMAFARDNPDEIAAVLLLDPRMPTYTPECLAAGQKLCDFNPEGLARRPPQQQREYRGLAAEIDRLRDASFMGKTPLVVLGAAKPAPGLPSGWQTFWLDHLQRFATSAPNGRFLPVPDSGHLIQKQRPDLVLGEILRLLQ